MILEVMKKIMLLIQDEKKKENWSSERYEMSKWNFGSAVDLLK